MSRYLINEVFYSLQGEGVRAGTAAVFVRFAKCNLACNTAEHGFDCDTDFEHGDWYGLEELVEAVAEASGCCPWVILTGGEPALQVDQALIDAFHARKIQVAIETNGTMRLPTGIDWVCMSPKPGTTLAFGWADEAKYVLAAGQLPRDTVSAGTRVVSPAFKGEEVDPDALAWCIEWVRAHPLWRLSVQQHKWWRVR